MDTVLLIAGSAVGTLLGIGLSRMLRNGLHRSRASKFARELRAARRAER